MQLRERAVEILSLLPGVPAELAHALQATRAPSHLADITASLMDVELAEKQMLLETLSTEERLRKVLQLLTHRIEVLRLSQEIGARTKEQLQDRERKFLLREQLKTIQKELGEERRARARDRAPGAGHRARPACRPTSRRRCARNCSACAACPAAAPRPGRCRPGSSG